MDIANIINGFGIFNQIADMAKQIITTIIVFFCMSNMANGDSRMRMNVFHRYLILLVLTQYSWHIGFVRWVLTITLGMK